MDGSRAIFLNEVSVYQNQLPVLHQINFSLDLGEFCYLVGKTGSGKSSLLKLLYAELPLIKGKAEVVGHDLGKLKKGHIPLLRRKLGIVFQDFQLLYNCNVNDNLSIVLRATSWKDKKKIDERIHQVLDSVNMLGKRYKNVYELSGGEQQRLVIARALLNQPELIIADEPTGNLDPKASLEVIELMLNISQSTRCAVLIATHDYHLIKKFPARTLKCEEGNIQALV